jgi:hypothetical protein
MPTHASDRPGRISDLRLTGPQSRIELRARAGFDR